MLDKLQAHVAHRPDEPKSVEAQAEKADTFDARCVRACTEDMKNRSERPPAFYDRFMLVRGFRGLGIRQDYVLYDRDLEVICAYRFLLD